MTYFTVLTLLLFCKYFPNVKLSLHLWNGLDTGAQYSNCWHTFYRAWTLDTYQTVWTIYKLSRHFSICPDNFLPVRNIFRLSGYFSVRIFFIFTYFQMIFTFSNTIIAITVKTLRVAMLTISFGPELNGWLYVQKRSYFLAQVALKHWTFEESLDSWSNLSLSPLSLLTTRHNPH